MEGGGGVKHSFGSLEFNVLRYRDTGVPMTWEIDGEDDSFEFYFQLLS